MPIQKRSALVKYSFALLCVVAIFGLRLAFWPILDAESPFVFFISAIVLTAWFGGFGPGGAATILSVPLIIYYFLEPYGTLTISSPGHAIQLAVYILIGLLISWLVENLHAARRRSEEAEQETRRRAAEADEGKRILDALMEYIPMGIIIAEGRDAKARLVSKYGLGLSGVAAEVVADDSAETGLHAWPVHHPDGHARATAAELPLERVIRSGEVIQGEEWLLDHPDGTLKPVLCNAGPIRDKDGSIAGGVLAWSDITDLKKAASELEHRVQERTAELARINEQLETERRRLFSFLDSLPFFVSLLSPDGTLCFANRCFRGLFPRDEDRPDLRPTLCRDKSGEHCAVCRASGTSPQTERLWTSLAGRHYQIYEYPFSSRENECQVLAMGIDITERREAERGQQREREKLLTILSSMREGVYIAGTSREIEYINPALEKEFGPLRGSKCHEYLHGRTEPCLWCKNPEVLAGQSVGWEWTSPKTGRVYDLFDTPIANSNGSISKLQILHDISEHKRVEEKLRHSEEFMRKILETLPVGVWICEKDGKLVNGNPRAHEIWAGAAQFGLEQAGEYKGWWLNSGRRIRGKEWALARAVFSGETSLNEEIEIECFDGTHKIILNSAVPVRGENEEIIGAIVVNQDVTEIKRVEEERARKHQQLESLWRISRKIDSDLDGFLDYVLSEMVGMSESPYGFIGFVRETEFELSVRSFSAETTKDCSIPQKPTKLSFSEAGILNEVIRKQKSLIINKYPGETARKANFPAGHVALHRLLLVPIVSAGRTILLGAIANKEKDYTEEDSEQIHAFLTNALVAMDKKKAEEALKESQIRLQHLSSELLTAQEAERILISRELHDELGQSLTLIKLQVGLIDMNLLPDQQQVREHCARASAHIDQVIENMRRMSRDLIPAALDNLGITAALQRLATDSMKASNIDITLELADIDHLFSVQSSILIYRVFQESLTNVMKHSEATRVIISATEVPGGVAFQIRDNGKGMDLEEVEVGSRSGRRGLGLDIMRERVRTLCASLEIYSQRGMGTRLSFSVPVENDGC